MLPNSRASATQSCDTCRVTSSTTLALVRHGETEWNAERRVQGRSDNPLNETGRSQVRAAAEVLRDSEWDFIVSSPLLRARQSAQILSSALGVPIIRVVPLLTERDYGPAEGLQDGDELRALRIPGGFRGAETEADVARRATAALRELVTEHPDARIIVVAHGGLIRITVNELSGSRITTVTNASHCVIVHEDEGAGQSRWSALVINGEAVTASM